MNDRSRGDTRPTVAARGTAQRLITFALVVAASGLLILGKADTLVMERLRSSVSDGLAPLMSILSGPADALNGVIDVSRSWLRTHEENAELRDERTKLLQWQSVALRLEAENQELRRLLNVVPAPEPRFAAARVVADTGGVYARSLLLVGGRADGIDRGHAVLTEEGLIGRIVGSSERSARVLLITDLNSRIPVVVQGAKARAILAGDNSDMPKLVRILPGSSIEPGDRVVTSSDANAFPPGLPIGVIALAEDGEIRVKPYADPTRLEYVRVADFGLRGILDGRQGHDPARAIPRTGSERERKP